MNKKSVKIVFTGGNGRFGNVLKKIKTKYKVYFPSRNQLDITNFKNKKVGLVLSGGVVKAAAWHMGVALALEELGFTFKSNLSPSNSSLEISTYVGSSVGALVNLYFACGYKPMEVIEAYLEKSKESVIKPITYSDMLSLKSISKKPKKPMFFNQFDNFPPIVRALISPIEKIDGFIKGRRAFFGQFSEVEKANPENSIFGKCNIQ